MMRTGYFACMPLLAMLFVLPVSAQVAGEGAPSVTPRSNPLIRDKFTADPAPLVGGDRLYLYVGHDQAQRDEMFNMREWLVYSTTDMATWVDHGPIMKVADFAWAKADAWASQAIEKDGRFWFYAAVEHDDEHPGKAIAVAVSDSPTGPFVDAKEAALITNEMTPKARTAGRTSIRRSSPTTMAPPGSRGATGSATSRGSSRT